MAARVDRRQVLGFRAAAQGLHRDDGAQAAVSHVLDLGVQDTPPGAAATAFAVRGVELADGGSGDHAIGGRLTITWSLRGAPHVHRSDDLAWLARALWPWSDDDALARLDTSASPIHASGMAPRDALRFVAERVAGIVTAPMPKGEVSSALTPSLPVELTVDCRSCKARHIVETLWRSAILPAGIDFLPGARTVTFVPIPDWPGVPDDTDGLERVIDAYLRLLGPAGPAELAGLLGTKVGELAPRWPDGLAEVELDGATRWVPEDVLPQLLEPPDPPPLRLLPPSDPWLQARDRSIIVPDEGHRSRLWPILGRPGAVLVDGEVAGVWRARKKGTRLVVTVEPFVRLTAGARRHLDDEAAVVAASRRVRTVDVTIERA